ncbi:MAG: hypothetical protein WStaBPW_26680 [Shewanella algae]|uniref:Uncharacterized protein n=1 Tax=Shewanella carassii TaxID=1987584 RepID=A0ABQ1T7Q9_9GAMM|nr:hypothetical protein BS332_13465 [Shewanella algae]BCV67463.1 hypothetical protein TUM17387_28220 [Shewanella carassii]AYV12942.1 hypothetical protein EEY24_08605 [Shewanella algae]OHY54022.1 hypothetical protein BEH76_11040 [Shewanella algae]PBQ28839.1 hypothetical protein AYI97_07370 [Shewanella algae]
MGDFKLKAKPLCQRPNVVEFHPTPEERGLYRLAPFPNPQRPATQRKTPCAYDANSLSRQTLIPDSTGAASASMPRYAIVINALRPLRAGIGAFCENGVA